MSYEDNKLLAGLKDCLVKTTHMVNIFKKIPDNFQKNEEITAKINSININLENIFIKINNFISSHNQEIQKYKINSSKDFEYVYDNLNENILKIVDHFKLKDKQNISTKNDNHISNDINNNTEIIKPQYKFKDTIDNSDNIFIPKILHKYNSKKDLNMEIINANNDKIKFYENIKDMPYEDQINYFEHPYKTEIEALIVKDDFIKSNNSNITTDVVNKSLDFEYIDNEESLLNMINYISNNCSIMAIDLEHHSEHSYQGFTCLIQISVFNKNYIIDAIEIREHLNILNKITTNENILKILHGSENDIKWLQKDFGVYVVNLFDTFVAAKCLKYNNCSFANLLFKLFNIITNKKFQTADWRLRPLTNSMLEYAVKDTCYLIDIYEKIKLELIEQATNNGLEDTYYYIKEIFNESKKYCLMIYKKPATFNNSYYNILNNQKIIYNELQLNIFKNLWEWRNRKAREYDESERIIMPNDILLRLCIALPKNKLQIERCNKYNIQFISNNYQELLAIINNTNNETKTIYNSTINYIDIKENNKLNLKFVNQQDIIINVQNNNENKDLSIISNICTSNNNINFDNYFNNYLLSNNLIQLFKTISRENKISSSNILINDIIEEEPINDDNYIEIESKKNIKSNIKHKSKEDICNKLQELNLPESLKERFNVNLLSSSNDNKIIKSDIINKNIKKNKIDIDNTEFEQKCLQIKDKISNKNYEDRDNLDKDIFDTKNKKQKKTGKKFNKSKFGKINITKNIKFN